MLESLVFLRHELHVLMTGEREGYYSPFGSLDGLVRELTRQRRTLASGDVTLGDCSR